MTMTESSFGGAAVSFLTRALPTAIKPPHMSTFAAAALAAAAHGSFVPPASWANHGKSPVVQHQASGSFSNTLTVRSPSVELLRELDRIYDELLAGAAELDDDARSILYSERWSLYE